MAAANGEANSQASAPNRGNYSTAIFVPVGTLQPSPPAKRPSSDISRHPQQPAPHDELSPVSANTAITPQAAGKPTEAEPQDTVMPAKTRKKGMAVKKPATKRKAAVKPKSKRSAVAETAADNNDNHSIANDGRGQATPDVVSESPDSGPYCICRGPDDHRWMIGCECCDEWFHGECIGLSKEVGEMLVEKFVCPNCHDAEEGVVTVYKKTCAMDGCKKPARLYGTGDTTSVDPMEVDGDHGDADGGFNEVVKKEDDQYEEAGQPTMGSGSAFCSDEHKDVYWDKIIAALPKEKDEAFQDGLTQQEVMALLAGGGDRSFPFRGDPFDPNRMPVAPLSKEEQDHLRQSEASRREMGEEIGVLKKMLKLLQLCSNRRKAAVEAGRLDKDTCGYDIRVDFIGEAESFRLLAQCPDMEPLFNKQNSTPATATLGPPRPMPPEIAAAMAGYHRLDFPVNDDIDDGKGGGLFGTDPVVGGMCAKKRCRAHAGWVNTHARNIKHTIGRLAEGAAAMLEEEKRIKDHAAVRFLRKKHERNEVIVLAGEEVWKSKSRKLGPPLV